MTSPFPDAEYLVLSSRLIPDRDGGYALATLARARQMAAAGVAGGLGPWLLTVDPGSAASHAQDRAAFAGRDLVVDQGRMRNLFDEGAIESGGAADWLVEAAHPGDPDPALQYRTVSDAAGRPFVRLPVIAGDSDWHLSEAPIAVLGSSGAVVGVVDGFGALYRAWLSHVVSGLRAGSVPAPAWPPVVSGLPAGSVPEPVEGSTSAAAGRPIVVLCESRQLGELLVGWDDPDARLVHTIHTIHLEPPFHPQADVNPLWARWFSLAERFDAVVWPTARQRDDVVERFGGRGLHVVVPHAVPSRDAVVPASARRPASVVMLNRLAPGKRIDQAIDAFVRVLAAVPAATLDVYGEGPSRQDLQERIDRLGLGVHVVLRGTAADAGRVLDEASVLLTTSAYEGQGLSIVEALAHGTPVVAYDIRYGPREALGQGGGVLVADGDVDALGDVLIRLLSDPEEHARLAREAVNAARRIEPHHVMASLAQAVTDVLARPSRRVGVPNLADPSDEGVPEPS